MARVGIIQTGGIGDIVIALPIAAWFADRGDTVFWPIDDRWLTFFAAAAPYATFLPVPSGMNRSPTDPKAYPVTLPAAALQANNVDRSCMLYSAMRDVRIENEKYSQHLKFDEYKYAVSGVPFDEKWNLRIDRDLHREETFFRSLGIKRQFICMHRKSFNFKLDIDPPPEWTKNYDIVDIDERTASPFDWLLTIERASKLVCIDSCFANLVEQLNLRTEKFLALRTPHLNTPVFKNGWTFV